jgi:6-pyruvoyltetrahydropterin/6-carboxytetrahydropterin synthase
VPCAAGGLARDNRWRAERGADIKGGPVDRIAVFWDHQTEGLPLMYSVTKRIEFCYGHRLLDYDGICKHPHGHNALAEIEVRTGTLDSRNMVCDFSDIKRIVKGWIDRELDHKMVLRHDDPLVEPLRALGEPMYLLDSNPTVERIARLIFDVAVSEGLPVVRVRVWETPTSFADYTG